ncbi:hypothetical protein PBI_KRATIO_79 [Mycobacterium phage Kratio]|uniref:Uncharacterized protein n=4 Tax=Kratiovirus TaxID=2948788 RepID=A0A222ZNA1_9CAUD|nr:hypothetical protein CL76_gp24 [Mycobacterium phage Larva]YP_009212825.1 hypothetical protein PBI_KRATIO_79 [Mycobacterium phage Kratio]ASR85772.1 hypothetical protein SEA_EDUGATOR_75 [Mycobacterium phage Edugator]QQV92679.1 hypothetical protein SEA_PSYCHO_77 [Mycobacterium phage Psycho]WAB09760.1 terminase large subunit, ATPase domain [Mycobacterium phage Dadosky]AEL19726.1 hypothetical protein LARVA_78 [Mycobacterium phage Larva]AJK27408.1 hypothetical protein PBI_KRATIO_79 [Mycobacteriu
MTYIEVRTDHRQQGTTTLLLDVALANARRGLDVVFWSASARLSDDAFRTATRLVPAVDAAAGVTFCAANGRQEIRYNSGGRVRFAWSGAQRITTPPRGLEIVDGIEFTSSVSRRDEDGSW